MARLRPSLDQGRATARQLTATKFEERSYRVIKSHSIDEEHEERCDSDMNLSIVWNFVFEVPYHESNVIEAWVSSECPCLLWTPYAAIKHMKT